MLALLGIVVSVGFADSINPSTVGPGLYLASYQDSGHSLLGFTAGVFTVSAVAGVVLVLGPGRLLLAEHPTAHVEHVIEVAAGIGLIAVAAGLWLVRERLAARIVHNERTVQRASVLFGAGVMAVELPTALPYFAVLAAVAGSGRPATTQVALVLLFNLIFVAPLLAVLSIRRLAGARGVDWLARRRERLERHAGEAVPALVLLIGAIIVAIGAAGLVAR